MCFLNETNVENSGRSLVRLEQCENLYLLLQELVTESVSVQSNSLCARKAKCNIISSQGVQMLVRLDLVHFHHGGEL